jgi:hypothetical protein
MKIFNVKRAAALATQVGVLLAILLTMCGLAVGQQPTFHDPLLDRFEGSWLLQGTIAGRETKHDVVAEWVLNHQYLQIHEVSHEKKVSGEPVYEAMVFVGWDEANSRYVCAWLDVYGGISQSSLGQAPRSGDEIRFLFNDNDGKPDFHTTFVYDRKADTWAWRMDNEDKGQLKPYARVQLTRK